MPRHIVSAEDIFVTPGEVAPITLTYRTNPEEENANTFNFSVAIDSSDLNVEDTNPDLTGIQLPEGTFVTDFVFGDTDPAEGFQSISADNDENDIDNDPSTDVLVTLAYARPFDGDWPFAAEGVDGQPVTLGTLEFTTLDDFTGTRANIILRDPDSEFIQADVAPEDQLGLFNIPEERLDAVNIKAENDIPNHAIDAELDSAFEPGSNVDISLTYSSQDPVRANANTFNFDVAINSSVFTIEDTNPDLTGIQLPEGTFVTDFVFGDINAEDEGFQSISANFDTEDVDNDPRTDVIITLAYARPFDEDDRPFEGDWPFAAEGVTEDQTSVDLGSLRLPLSGDFNPETQATTVNVVLREPDSDFEGSQGDVLDQLTLPLDVVENEPPQIQTPGEQNIDENNTAVVTVEATDPDGDNLSFSLSGGADQGRFAIDADGNLSFAEAPNFENPQDDNGDNVYEVDVTVSDGNEQTEDVTQSFQVTVNDVNEAPVAEDDTATTDEDSVLEVGITPRQVVSAELLNDAVADDEANIALRYSTANPPQQNAQTFNFQVAVDSSQFVIEDTNTELSDIQLSDEIFVDAFEFGSLFGTVPSASEDTEDIDNNPDTDVVITFAYFRLDGDWPFGADDVAPDQEVVDLGTLSLPLSDGFDETTAQVTLREPDSNFEGNNGDILTTIALPSGDTESQLASNLLANDSDPDEGDTLTISAVNGDAANVGTEVELASGALLTVNDNGSYIFDPNGAFESLPVGQSEDVTFTYTVSDAEGLPDEATATITVEGRNDTPEFVAPDPFEFTVDEFVETPTDGGNGASDAPVQIEVNLLANENGTPGAELTPADIANGDSFFVEVVASADDPSGISSLSLELGFDSTVLSAVEEQFNDATNIIVDRFDFDLGRVADLENGTITLAGGTIDATTDDDGDGVPDNVIGANGNPEQFALLQFEAIADPTDTVIDLEFPGVDDNGNPLGGTLGDATALSDVELDVQDFTFSDTQEGDGTFVGIVEAVDPDEGDTVSLSLTGDVDDDLFTIDAETGELSFNEAPDFENPQDEDGNNIYEVEVTATDSEGEAVSDTLDVIVENVNEVPTAQDDTGSTDEDTVLTVEVAEGVLANDTDPDGDDLTVSAVNGGEDNVGTEITLDSGALLTLNADGSYEYDSNGVFDELNDGETATDTFTYTVADGNGGTDTAEVTITIDGITDNVPPNFVDTEIAVDENTTAVPLEVEDADGDEVTLSLAGGDDRSLFEIDPNTGDLRFITAPDFENPLDDDRDNLYEVEVTADDGNGGTTTELLEITVTDQEISGDPNEPNVVNIDPSEPLIHTLDTETGNSDGLVEVGLVLLQPGQTTEAALEAGANVRTVFSVFPDTFDNGEPGTFEDLGTIQRILSVVGSNRVGYVLNEGNDQTIDEILAQDTNNLAESFEFGNFNQSQQGNTLTLEAGGVTFEVSQTGEESPLGANLQAQGLEVFDLRENVDGTQLTENDAVDARLSFDLISVAAFDNAIGFYTVDGGNGAIDGVNPGDEGYLDALLSNVVTDDSNGEEEDIILRGGANVDETSAEDFEVQIQGGQIIVPFIIARGGNLDALPDGADELPLRSEIYTPFIGANSDGADHFRLLADNTFGIEDLRGGGDQDFNDIIFQFDFA
ncbi:Ig-like domain-containing protein [Dactylococcopsis salina]|uniref:Cadherin domain-containing protein n=1 Tax=Dactylococcopsis salina (strain PCC 8305) TaxID=13035 RepID=K9YRM0_DACS8|nr:Ig-like domain-containing protein [Dactylococcopsis salina]AFZ49132.1 Cadherin domain-containing protein [Dactylococcopsis salina PCC 8305]